MLKIDGVPVDGLVYLILVVSFISFVFGILWTRLLTLFFQHRREIVYEEIGARLIGLFHRIRIETDNTTIPPFKATGIYTPTTVVTPEEYGIGKLSESAFREKQEQFAAEKDAQRKHLKNRRSK